MWPGLSVAKPREAPCRGIEDSAPATRADIPFGFVDQAPPVQPSDVSNQFLVSNVHPPDGI